MTLVEYLKTFPSFVWEHHRLSFICWLCFPCPVFVVITCQALQQAAR